MFWGIFHGTRQRWGVDFGVPGVRYKVGRDFEEDDAVAAAWAKSLLLYIRGPLELEGTLKRCNGIPCFAKAEIKAPEGFLKGAPVAKQKVGLLWLMASLGWVSFSSVGFSQLPVEIRPRTDSEVGGGGKF